MVKRSFSVASSLLTHKQLQLVLYRRKERARLSVQLQSGRHRDKHEEVIFTQILVIFHKTHKRGQSDDLTLNQLFSCVMQHTQKSALWPQSAGGISPSCRETCSVSFRSRSAKTLQKPWCLFELYNSTQRQSNRGVYLFSYYICF